MKYYVVRCGAEVLVSEQSACGQVIGTTEERLAVGHIFEESFLKRITKCDCCDERTACFFVRRLSDDVSEYWHVDMNDVFVEENIEKAEWRRENFHAADCMCEDCKFGFLEIKIPDKNLSNANKVSRKNNYFLHEELFDKGISNGYYEVINMGIGRKVRCSKGFIVIDHLNSVMDKLMIDNPFDCWIEDVTVLDGNKLRLKLGS